MGRRKRSGWMRQISSGSLVTREELGHTRVVYGLQETSTPLSGSRNWRSRETKSTSCSVLRRREVLALLPQNKVLWLASMTRTKDNKVGIVKRLCWLWWAICTGTVVRVNKASGKESRLLNWHLCVGIVAMSLL